MSHPQVTAIYFSPTGTSKKGAEQIARTLDPDFKRIDITRLYALPAPRQFNETELVVFGAPVYGGRLFQGCVPAFQQFQGNGTPCIITVTYGNRHYDDALLELVELATAQGFIPIAAAALIGEHTYGEVQLGRPNAQDLAEDAAFAQKLLRIDRTTPVTVPGNHPYKDGGNAGSFYPSTLANCTHCGLCAVQCPVQAINPFQPEVIDPSLCLSCFRCVKTCPVHAKACTAEEYQTFATAFTKRLEARRENEYFFAD